MGAKSKPIWALVTDGGFGRLFELEESPPRIREVGTREAPTRHMTSREITSDLSGREFNSAAPVRHAKQPRSDPHDEAERLFVEGWADGLQQALSKHRFDRLLLVADPRTLGRLRACMDNRLRATVAAESPLDLTKLSLHDLEPRLRELAGWSRG